jgi:hypothetical protein
MKSEKNTCSAPLARHCKALQGCSGLIKAWQGTAIFLSSGLQVALTRQTSPASLHLDPALSWSSWAKLWHKHIISQATKLQNHAKSLCTWVPDLLDHQLIWKIKNLSTCSKENYRKKSDTFSGVGPLCFHTKHSFRPVASAFQLFQHVATLPLCTAGSSRQCSCGPSPRRTSDPGRRGQVKLYRSNRST